MELEKVKDVFDLFVSADVIQLQPKQPGYKADGVVLQAIEKLKIHKQNTLHVLLNDTTDAPVIAVDIETTAKHFLDGDIRLISMYSTDMQIVTPDVEEVVSILGDPQICKIFHNAAFDVTWLKAKGFEVTNYTDTMVMAQIVHNTTKSTNSLKALAFEYFGEVLNKDKQSTENWQGELSQEHRDYALKDAEITFRLYQALSEEIKTKHLDVVLAREIRALPAVIELSLNGIPFDYSGWQVVLDEMQKEVDGLENEIKNHFKLSDLLLTSPKQLLDAFATVGIILTSTKEEELAKHESKHPVIAKVCRYKRLKKRISTYGEGLKAKIQPNGRVYGNWRLIGTDTSRMSCKNPNLQGLPTQAKQFVKAPEGKTFIVADYSTIELRILAEITRDEKMVQAFTEGEDLHRKTAQGIFNLDSVEQVSKEERQIGKVVNFGLIYGMTSYGLQKRITAATGKSISLQKAVSFRDNYFKFYPSVLLYQDSMLKADVIQTLGGRYWGEGLKALKKGSIARYNYPIQGTGAEGMKNALALLLERKINEWKLIAAIHDEIVLEVPIEQAYLAKETLHKVMQEGMQHLIPSIQIEIDINICDKWTK